MKLFFLKKITLPSILISIFANPFAFGASTSPALLKAKQDAQAKGYIFFANHDEIVAGAKKEGKLRVNSGTERATFKPLIVTFKQKYPFISDVHLEEIQGADAYQRFILEIKSGHAKGWDTTHVPLDFASDYMPYMKKYDILAMAEHGVLTIDPRMIHPVERNIVGYTSTIQVISYNKKLLSENIVPNQWEDFLKPEFKGRKFVVDTRPYAIAALVPAWGLEKTLDFSRKIAAQQPVWGSSVTRITAAILAGEYSLHLGSNFNSVKRAISKDATGSLSYRIIEPVPTRMVARGDAILPQADHPYAALLWFEFLASAEGQEILDKYEPFKASVFTPGSVAEQITRGKKLSAVDWQHYTKTQEHQGKVIEAFGFPKADR